MFDSLRGPARWWSLGPILVWVFVLVSTPIVLWAAGQGALVFMASLGVSAQAFAVGVVFFRGSGGSRKLACLMGVLVFCWLAEFIGTRTGFPFGRYAYTSMLQPQIGAVPILIPLAWWMMVPPAWGLADWFLGMPRPVTWRIRLWRAAVAAAALTVWDLYLDPQMVGWGFWKWSAPGIYFGIPLSNYLGWLGVAFLMTFLLMPEDLPTGPLVLIYALTAILQFIGQVFFWDLTGPALVGAAGMGGILLWAVVRDRKRKHMQRDP
jgi:lycopene beta-cyclase